MRVTFLGEVVLIFRVHPHPSKLHAVTEMPSLPNKKKSFLDIISYLGKFFPSTVDLLKPLRKLSSTKTEWA